MKLNTDNPNPYSGFGALVGEYYREENGLVYMKQNENQEEQLIYNFNLIVGEQFQIENSFLIEVISIDSITLNSGEKRKRILH